MIDLKDLREEAEFDLEIGLSTMVDPEIMILLLERLRIAEANKKPTDLGKKYWYTKYKECHERSLIELSKLQDKLDKAEQRIEAAEKVCDAVKMLSLQVPYQSNKNGIAVWGEIDNALKKWQEVVKCADQQQKK